MFRLQYLVWIALILQTGFAHGQVGGGEITSLNAFRARQKTKQFVGQYLQRTSQGDDIFNVTDNNGFLKVREARGTNVARISLKIDLSKLGQRITTREHTSNGWFTVERFGDIQGDSAILKETYTRRFYRYIEVTTMRIDGPYMVFLFERTFYRRQFFISGPWVIDHFIANRDDSNYMNYRALKLSRKPLPAETYYDMISARKSSSECDDSLSGDD